MLSDRVPPDAATALLRAHPAWPGGAPPGAGLSLPEFEAPREIALEAAQAEALAEFGITWRRPPGPGCRLFFDLGTPRQRLVLDLARASGVAILLGPGAALQGEVGATGEGHLLAAAGAAAPVVLNVHVTFRGARGLVALGRGVSSNRTNFLAEGPEGVVLVGDDCMFATNTTVRTSDSHAIIDIASATQVNLPEPVVIGRHVWLGQDALVMKGVTVGQGAIVAGRAVVTADVAPRTLVAGTPARVIREGVTWSRRARPSAAEIAAEIGEG